MQNKECQIFSNNLKQFFIVFKFKTINILNLLRICYKKKIGNKFFSF